MRIRTSIFAKGLAWLLVAVSGMGLLASGFFAVGMEEAGFYSLKYQEIREKSYATFSDRYSARVLHYLGSAEDSNHEYFVNKNFKYGVIEADFLSDIENLNLNDPNIYVERNFDFEKTLLLEDMHVFQCTINENTYFSYSEPDSLWGHYWISNTSDNWVTIGADRILYDLTSGIVFVSGDDRFYPIPKIVMHITTTDGNTTDQGFAFDRECGKYKPDDDLQMEFGEHQYNAVLEITVIEDTSMESVLAFLQELHDKVSDEGLTLLELEDTLLGSSNWAKMDFATRQEVYENTEVDANSVMTEVVQGWPVAVYDINSYTFSSVSDVEFSYATLDPEVTSKNLDKEIRMNINEYGEIYVYVKPADMISTSYYVLSYQEPGYAYVTDLTAGETDLFGQFDIVVGTLYSMRYQVFAIFFACLAVFAVAFIFLCCAAGHKKGQTELVQTWFNRVPLEIYATVFVFGEAFCIALANETSWNIGGVGDVFWMIATAVLVLFAGLFLTSAGLEFVTRIKLGILWKHTLCYWIISNLFGGMKQAAGFVAEHTSLVWKAVFVVGANAIVDFIIFLILANETGLGFFLFVIKTAALLLVALSAVSQLKKLKEAGEHMAKGDLNHRVDTKGLRWDFKQHGENLNSVNEGLSIAVEERMKSERFKTELITNVSHDIKTPLTSIINYVDLMQKEEVNNEKIEEYLEVLERQSKRLKKLLEDLLEASKASAGTLAVGLEELEAGVFMVQTVGEFEEKTAAQDLELIIKKPEEPVYINADGRHFWRVIDNLMNNICKYAQPHTRVYINLEVTNEDVYITFRNTSRYPLNITSEELMERFVRGDESRHTEGSGLGLSIAQSLMELMHGKFELFVDGDLFKVVLTFKRVSGEK